MKSVSMRIIIHAAIVRSSTKSRDITQFKNDMSFIRLHWNKEYLSKYIAKRYEISCKLCVLAIIKKFKFLFSMLNFRNILLYIVHDLRALQLNS